MSLKLKKKLTSYHIGSGILYTAYSWNTRIFVWTCRCWIGNGRALYSIGLRSRRGQVRRISLQHARRHTIWSPGLWNSPWMIFATCFRVQLKLNSFRKRMVSGDLCGQIFMIHFFYNKHSKVIFTLWSQNFIFYLSDSVSKTRNNKIFSSLRNWYDL